MLSRCTRHRLAASSAFRTAWTCASMPDDIAPGSGGREVHDAGDLVAFTEPDERAAVDAIQLLHERLPTSPVRKSGGVRARCWVSRQDSPMSSRARAVCAPMKPR